MRRNIQQLPGSVVAVTTLVAVALVVSLGLVLRREQGLRADQENASDRVLRSALLPDDGWATYGGEEWSMGYPEDWQLTILDTGVSVADEDGNTYLTAIEETRAMGEIETVYANDASVTRSEFLFASYPTVKFAHLGGREEYYIAYNNQVFSILTDQSDEEEVGIMLATFQFLY